MEINVVFPSKWDSDQDPIEDIINLQKVFREEAKAPTVIHVPEKLVKAIALNGILGSVAGKALRESIQEAAKAMSEFGIIMVDTETFTEAVKSLHTPTCEDVRKEFKSVCYKPSQFPLKRNKKDIYKRL